MSVELNIEINGLNRIKEAFARRPDVVKRYINRAIEASIFQIEKDATDDNFQFKTSRSQRTGYLQRSFKFGIVSRDFFGSIGPTANYASYVHRNNEFMPRIARASQPFIQKYFEDALSFIVDDLEK